MADLISSSIKKPFDPVVGSQGQSTGLLAGLLILSLMAGFGFYKTFVLTDGGSPIPVIFTWLPRLFQFPHVHRDYYDILAITLAGFSFMVSWEFFKAPRDRFFTATIAVVGLVIFWLVALDVGAQPGTVTSAYVGDLTRLECILILLIVSLNVSWVSRMGVAAKSARLKPAQALRPAFFRWISGLSIFTLFWMLTFVHPFYKSGYYENWRITCDYLYVAFLFFGFPYAFVTNWLRGGRFEHRSDPCFVFLLLFRNSFRVLRGKSSFGLWRCLQNRRVQVALRDILVKIFFVPLMVTFLFSESGNFFSNFSGLLRGSLPWTNAMAQLAYGAFYHSLFVMDVGLCLLGYLSSSRWLANKSRGVEPTISGWMVAIICYPPFNEVMSQFLPYDSIHGRPFAFLQTAAADGILKGFTLVLFIIYVWASMSFGLRFSNLTNRGIVTRGPYAFIRHPAYISKNLAWWTENVRSFSSPLQFFFMAGWNVIYCLRALTEERHLMSDPDYRAYCEQVKYRFIPGVW